MKLRCKGTHILMHATNYALKYIHSQELKDKEKEREAAAKKRYVITLDNI